MRNIAASGATRGRIGIYNFIDYNLTGPGTVFKYSQRRNETDARKFASSKMIKKAATRTRLRATTL